MLLNDPLHKCLCLSEVEAMRRLIPRNQRLVALFSRFGVCLGPVFPEP